MIDTPDGPIRVTSLRVGDRVFSRDELGVRTIEPVLSVHALAVIEPHQMTELTLSDGRVVRASAGHPLGRGGGSFGELHSGDVLDGATILSVETAPYDGSHTWELLPGGSTGEYWADGVPVGSTLHAP